MRRIGFWMPAPPAGRGSFETYLQWSFLPAARAALAAGRPLPERSSIGTAAVRTFDGCPDADQLANLCAEFDWVFDGRDGT